MISEKLILDSLHLHKRLARDYSLNAVMSTQFFGSHKEQSSAKKENLLGSSECINQDYTFVLWFHAYKSVELVHAHIIQIQ